MQRILLAVMSVVLLNGCAVFERHIYIESRRPIIPTPAVEQLATLPSDEQLFTEDRVVDPGALKDAYIDATTNLAIVLHETSVLRDLIEKYNEVSEAKNIENGFTLPRSSE